MNILDKWGDQNSKAKQVTFQIQVIEKDCKFSKWHSGQAPESAWDLDTTFGNNNIFYGIFYLMHIAALVFRVLNVFPTKTKNSLLVLSVLTREHSK